MRRCGISNSQYLMRIELLSTFIDVRVISKDRDVRCSLSEINIKFDVFAHKSTSHNRNSVCQQKLILCNCNRVYYRKLISHDPNRNCYRKPMPTIQRQSFMCSVREMMKIKLTILSSRYDIPPLPFVFHYCLA